MTKEMVVIVLGMWVTLLPFLGFPESWRRPMFIAAGLLTALLAFLLYREARDRHPRKKEASFKQNGSSHTGNEIFEKTDPIEGHGDAN